MNNDNMSKEISKLVEEAIGGNHIAWNTLIIKFQKRVFGMAMVITKDVHDADDATQDTFITLFKNLKKLREPEKLEGWLIKTAVNKAKDIRRRKKIRAWLPISRVKNGEPSEAEESLYLKELRKIFDEWSKANLSGKEQLVFQLRFGEDKELNEIAELLGMNINTVKTHLHRAVKKLRPQATKLIKGNNND